MTCTPPPPPGATAVTGGLTCPAAAAGMWLLQGAALGEDVQGRPSRGARSQAQCLLQQISELPGQLASYVLAHSVGRWFVYPSSMFLMTRALLPLLQQGQERLVDRYRGRCAKLVACDGNEIDTMFMDRRQRLGSHGRGLRLAICCEGNAGFYEMGCLSAPLEAGYSVLGWNHPGFGGSTGAPFPQRDANAMDVVVKYALYRLHFPPAHVVVYGWSICGFTASWATMRYPELGALVLDATFDDLVPLALKVKPHSWKGLVVRTVREHFNLNVAEQLCHYPGRCCCSGARRTTWSAPRAPCAPCRRATWRATAATSCSCAAAAPLPRRDGARGPYCRDPMAACRQPGAGGHLLRALPRGRRLVPSPAALLPRALRGSAGGRGGLGPARARFPLASGPGPEPAAALAARAVPGSPAPQERGGDPLQSAGT